LSSCPGSVSALARALCCQLLKLYHKSSLPTNT
jgi:hypothetical protein